MTVEILRGARWRLTGRVPDQRPECLTFFLRAGSKFPLGARQLAGDARVVPARGVHGACERLEQRLDDVVRFITVKQFQMQIAARFIREPLEKFTREAKAKGARNVLAFFHAGNFLLRKLVQPAPDEMRATAEIHHATCEALV